jgi:hypothetical protein
VAVGSVGSGSVVAGSVGSAVLSLPGSFGSSVYAPGASGICCTAADPTSSGSSKSRVPSLIRSVSSIGASRTATSSPAGSTFITLPSAFELAYITLPGARSETPLADLSMVQVSPSELACRIAFGPSPMMTTPGW